MSKREMGVATSILDSEGGASPDFLAEYTISDIITAVPLVPPKTTNNEILKFFTADSKLPGIVVVDDQSAILGLLDRESFRNLFFSQFGHPLYSRQPVTAVMLTDYLVLAPDTPVLHAYAQAVSRHAERKMESIPVLNSGSVLGVVTVPALMNRVAQIQREMIEHWEKMRKREAAALEWEQKANISLKEGIGSIIAELKRYSSGNLAPSNHPVHFIGPIAEVAKAVDVTREQLSAIVGSIETALQGMESGLCRTQSIVAALEDGATVHEEQVGQLTQTFDRIFTFALEGAEASQKTIASFDELRTGGKDGMDKVRDTLSHISVTVDSVQAGIYTLGNLEKSMAKANQISDLISDSAERSGIVALNAAIIAAQAGEKGRAFSVVAEELRGLSKETSLRNLEIARILVQIRSDMEILALNMRQTSQVALQGKDAVRMAQSGVDRVMETFDGADRLIKDLSTRLESQQAQVCQGKERLKVVAEQTAMNRVNCEAVRINHHEVISAMGGLRGAAIKFRLV